MGLRFLFAFIMCCFLGNVMGQDSRLAYNYMKSGEYEKASILFKKLYDKNPKNETYFSKHIDALVELEEYERAQKALKEELKRKPNSVHLYVTYGNLYSRMDQPEKADKQFRKAINELPANHSQINKLGNGFIRLSKFDLALETYQKGADLLNNNGIFSYSIADIYRRKGEVKGMIDQYLNYASNDPRRVNTLKKTFQNNLKEKEDYTELKKQLYERINLDQDNVVFPELLEWVFITEKNYAKAFRQARSIDKQKDENGKRVIDVGQIALNDESYDVAIDAFNYVIEEKGKTSSYFLTAKKLLLTTRKEKILSSPNIKPGDFDSLKIEYKSFINEIGINNSTAPIVQEYTEFLAYQVNDVPEAMEILQQLVDTRAINKDIRAESKISLADYFLLAGDIWESTLLYSQVDKEFKEDYIGEVARYKNAMLFYYAGNFEWAQELFDILKASTSKLISNDAIDKSVFITTNLGLDSTDTALKLFSKADLLAVQNKNDEAFSKLDSIKILFPEHDLEDDVLYREAGIYSKLQNYDKAISRYERIIEEFPEAITCDNSIYDLAKLYELTLDEPSKAQALYEKLFIDYSNSTFAVDARKRYRILRGDKVEEAQ